MNRGIPYGRAMSPRIGLSTAPRTRDDTTRETLDRRYVTAVVGGGGFPLLLPVLDPTAADDAVDALDGLLLVGGGDVDPSYYGAEPAPETALVDSFRDRWELALVAAARARAIPILGICRGAQILAVAHGGRLIQHVPAMSALPHRVLEREDEAVHEVAVEAGSMLAELSGPGAAGVLGVNSLHHQGVDDPGTLRVVGRSPDGLIEAVEAHGSERILGVQWHPELLTHLPAHAALFTWLAAQAAAVPTR